MVVVGSREHIDTPVGHLLSFEYASVSLFEQAGGSDHVVVLLVQFSRET